MVAQNTDRMVDANLILHDKATAITADELGSVGGSASAGILRIGAIDQVFDVAFDVSACDVATGDELYEVQILGSNSSSFASGVALLGVLQLGDATTLAGGTGGVDTDKTTGRHILTVRNRITSTVYEYVRLNVEMIAAGQSITMPKVFISKITAA
jgi:hypothetical protein